MVFEVTLTYFFTLPHFNSARIISALLCTIVRVADKKLKEASTHKIAMTNAGNAFVPRDLDLWPFDPTDVKHFCIEFGDPSCICFWYVGRKQTNKQTYKRRWQPYSTRDYRLSE